MKYYKEFPSIEIPDFLQCEAWEDHSWHDDATAHSQLPFKDGSGLVVWVAEDNKSLREHLDMGKYLVEYQSNIAEWTEEGRKVLYEGNSELSVLLAIAQTIAAKI